MFCAAAICRMDPEIAKSFEKDLLDDEKLKDVTAADGTLPGGACVKLQRAYVVTYVLRTFQSLTWQSENCVPHLSVVLADYRR